MQAEAIFEYIEEQIISEIRKARHSVYIAVPKFSNKNIFNILKQKSNKSCKVYIMFIDDVTNNSSSNNFLIYNSKNLQVFPIKSTEEQLTLNKFCVIDNQTIITGTYNWSNITDTKFENIIITKDDLNLVKQLVSEFNRIKALYFNGELNENDYLPVDKIIKRFEIIKNYIILEEVDEIHTNVRKLKKYAFYPHIQEIINSLKNGNFGDAVQKIDDFINDHTQLAIWNDPVLKALQLELKLMEVIVNALDNKKRELNKILTDFEHRYSVEVGDIVLELLKLKKIKFKDNKKRFEEAEKEEETFRQQFKVEKQKNILEITQEQKQELKRKYRKASTLCHPDKFANESEEKQKHSEKIFRELNNAYEKNDLTKVSEILEYLEKGILKTGKQISDKEILLASINRLKAKRRQLEKEIIEIKQSKAYQSIISIKDLDTYFKELKEKLQNEITKLKYELKKHQ